MRRGGFLVSIVEPPSEDSATEHGVEANVVYAHPEGTTLAEIAKLVEEEQVRARVDTVLPLSEIAQAHQLMKNGHKRGKIVLQIG